LQIAPHRLLGFAFASADLLMEVGVDGKITFAVGAAATLSGKAETALMGHKWREFVDERDEDLINSLFLGLEGSARQGPVVARIAGATPSGSQAFAICACRLPQNQRVISCALSRAALPVVSAGDDGLYDRQDFEAVTKSLFETARATGQELELALVEMAGLEGLERALPPAQQRALKARVASALRAQSHGGLAASQLDAERYALVVDATGESPEALASRVGKLLGLVADVGEVTFSARTMALTGAVAPSQAVRAIRYALDNFVRQGGGGAAPLCLQDAINESVRQTLEKAAVLGSTIADRSFTLVYQPVVGLKSAELHHYEVLIRFGDDASPFAMIRMAEELDVIEALDLAVAERAAAKLVSEPKLRLAVNVSGRTITSPSFVVAMTSLVDKQPGLKGRLIFEVTESAAIDDLSVAEQHIQALRGLGCLVCLDDFGAGAASLAYLQQLSLDVVKIDGRYIRDLHHGGRESTFIRHLVSMCAELKVETIAEMVESAAAEEAVRLAGVDYAQGYLYGAPAANPEPPKLRPGKAKGLPNWGHRSLSTALGDGGSLRSALGGKA
jgi:EAL domain-containing protein (putative c-di-GMP-specific phosphodiesterase class I)